jgi:hypothetical protein
MKLNQVLWSRLEEGGVKTDIQLRTEPVDELMDFDLDTVACKVILRSHFMRDLLGEVDGNSPDTVQISVVPNDQLKISGTGISGLMQVRTTATLNPLSCIYLYSR